jgi:hypothetical protein
MVAGVFKSLLKTSMQASFQGRQSATSVESAGTGVEAATFEDLMSRKTKANLAWYFRPAVHRVALSIVLVRRPTKCCSAAFALVILVNPTMLLVTLSLAAVCICVQLCQRGFSQ